MHLPIVYRANFLCTAYAGECANILSVGWLRLLKRQSSNEVVVRYIIVNFANSQEGEKHSLVKSHGTSFTSSSSNARKGISSHKTMKIVLRESLVTCEVQSPLRL